MDYTKPPIDVIPEVERMVKQGYEWEAIRRQLNYKYHSAFTVEYLRDEYRARYVKPKKTGSPWD